MDCQRILDVLRIAVVAVDSGGRISDAGGGVERLLGWPAAELAGRPLAALISDRGASAHRRGLERFLADPTASGIRLPALHRNGGEIEVEWRPLPPEGNGGGSGARLIALLEVGPEPAEEPPRGAAHWLRAVATAAARLSGRQDLESWGDSVVQAAVVDFDAALARLWIADPASRTMGLAASFGPALGAEDVEEGRRIDLAWPPSLFDKAFRGREPIVHNGLEGDPDFDQAWVRRQRIAAVGLFPLRDRDEPLGLLMVFSRRLLAPGPRAALEAFAAVAAAGLGGFCLERRSRQVQKEAEDQRRKLLSLFDALPLGVLLVEGREERITLVNPAGLRIGGRDFANETLERFQDRLAYSLPTGEPLAAGRRPLSRAVHEHESVHQTVRCRHEDGREQMLEVDAVPFPHPEGGAVAFFRDVTEEWRLRAELAERAAQVKALLEHLPVGVAYFDERGVCRASNGPARRIFGRPREPLTDRTAAELFARAPALQEALARCLRDRATHAESGVAWDIPDGTGRTLFLDWRFEPLPTPAGAAAGALALLVDVTERTRAADQLQRAAEHAEQTSRAKSRFLSALSHDLRTPVNGLALQAEWLNHLVGRLPQPAPELVSLAAEIRLATSSLGELVNDLLELTVIDSGALTFLPTAIALESWLDATLSPLRLMAQTRGLTLSWSVEPAGLVVRADRVKLGRVLVNLVGNALKFTERGAVTVAAGTAPDGWFALSVADTGPGIPAAEIEHIFDEFAQLRNPERDRTKGTGLGLAICRRLVTGCGGRLTVESAPGQGSRFTALYPPCRVPEAPAADPPPEAAAVPGPAAPARGPILLVEDDAFSRSALAHLLEGEGYEITPAADGPTALSLAEQRPPALVLLDLMLPGMDGAEVLRVLRERADPTALPVVILSGDVLSSRPARLEELGINGLLAKPIDLEALLGTLRRWLGTPAAP